MHLLSLTRLNRGGLFVFVFAVATLAGFSQMTFGDAAEWQRQASNLAQPLQGKADLDSLVAVASDRRLALLGEASHGTHEFYRWRDKISRRLIEEHDFAFIAVEGDWAELQQLNRYVKGKGADGLGARDILRGFERWPTWMWANEEIVELAEWLREYNENLPPDRRVGFHGLDLYGAWDSMNEVIAFFEEHDEEKEDRVRQLYSEWARYKNNGQRYARAVFSFMGTAEEDVREVVEKVKSVRPDPNSGDKKAWFEAKQNAIVVKNAELHFRSMIEEGAGSWNSRARHMAETANRLLAYYGPDARGIVWAHNTHVGDAQATDMAEQGRVNIGHLARQDLGAENVFIVGFGTHEGTVVAGREWGSPRQVMDVPRASSDSVESYLHGVADKENFWMLFDDEGGPDSVLAEPRGHRAIGVVYHPERDHMANYVPTSLVRRYDAFLFLNETRALSPLD